MKQIELLLKEMNMEANTTRKMLALLPEDKYNWQPHPKSMSLIRLATHVAELPTWVSTAINTDELDFAKNEYKPEQINSNAELLAYFERNLEVGLTDLAKANEQLLDETWTMRNGEQIYMVSTKGETVRHAFSQTTHHRAQLGVFLRLLDIPIPGSYGPSADEMGMGM